MNIDLQNTTQKTYDKQFYGQEKKDKWTNHLLQNNTYTTKGQKDKRIYYHETRHKPWVHSSVPDG